jgi:hypothetical protein
MVTKPANLPDLKERKKERLTEEERKKERLTEEERKKERLMEEERKPVACDRRRPDSPRNLRDSPGCDCSQQARRGQSQGGPGS